MRLPTRTLAAALVVAAVPLYAGSASAAPLSQSVGLNNADVGQVEQVQYRRWNRGRWIGPAAAGLAAGALIGGAIAASQYNDGYYAYGAAPRYGAARYNSGYYAYGAAPGYYSSNTRTSPQWGSCTGDREDDSSFPSWACR
jgi:hypothetical protein